MTTATRAHKKKPAARRAGKKPKNIGNLTAEQVRTWATREALRMQAKAEFDRLDEECKELRDRYEQRMAPSPDKKDEGKKVKIARAGGWQIRVSRYDGAEFFSITDFREAGGEVTEEMELYLSPPSECARVTVKRLAGPAKPGEPA